MMEQRYNAINDEWQQTFIYSHKNWDNPQKYQTFENGELIKATKTIKSIYLFNYDRDGNYLGYEYKLWDKIEKSLKYNYDTNGLLISSEEYVWNPNWVENLSKPMNTNLILLFCNIYVVKPTAINLHKLGSSFVRLPF